MKLIPGDIVLVHSDGFVGWAIRQIERGRGERPSRVNHVGIVTEVHPEKGPMITEALPSGTVKRPLVEAYAGTGVWLTIVRHRGISDARRQKIAEAMEAYIGHRYGFVKIALHLLQRWTGIGFTKLCVWDDRPICSYAAAQAFARDGLTFGKPAYRCDPDDIDDWTYTHRIQWERVFELAPFEGLDEPKEAA